MRRVGRWLYDRLEPEGVLSVLRHPVPPQLEGRVGWWYVTGSAVLVAFLVQVVTGVGLAMVYVPAPNSAYDSLRFITDEAALGGFIRGMHFWGSGVMVVLALAHMTQVYLFGAHKYPRELNWMTGSILLLATLAMAFTGQLLRWDQDAFWAIVVAAQQAARAPLVGDWLAAIVVAGANVGGATLTRFYATHVFLIPAAIYAVIAVHLYLVVRKGISEPPVAGERVDPRTYAARYAASLRRGIPFFPDALWRDAVAGLGVVVVTAVLAATVGAPHLGEPADPTIVNADPRPDWYFIGYFALLALIPKELQAPIIVGLPLLAFAFLFLLPLARPYGERHPTRRPAALLAVGAGVVFYGWLTVAGYESPWAPFIPAEGERLPASVTAGLGARAAAGAEEFVAAGCWSCHAISGSGGRYGPDLTTVGDRMDESHLRIRILTGGARGMPSYAGALDPEEVDDLVSFLRTRTAGR